VDALAFTPRSYTRSGMPAQPHTPPAAPTRVLFVCWGNICRSPTAEAVLRAQVAEAGMDAVVEVDSAGTSAEHAGDPPDGRAVAEAARRGLDLGSQRARRVRADDWRRFDLLLVADEMVERALLRLAPDDTARAKVHRMTAFAAEAATDEVPDPYYGGPDGFEHVYRLLEVSCRGLVEHLRARQG
jgi:protein-tyrosine phosphatase